MFDQTFDERHLCTRLLNHSRSPLALEAATAIERLVEAVQAYRDEHRESAADGDRGDCVCETCDVARHALAALRKEG